MSGRQLVVRVEEVVSRQSWVYVFEGGPVWVGCTSSSTLPIARPFILEQHGMFVFDARAVRYQDLDPRAGSTVDGDPAGGGEHLLTEHSQVEMGPVRLTVSRRLPDEPIRDPALSPFAAHGVPTMVLPPRDLPPAPAPPPPAMGTYSTGIGDRLDLSAPLSLEDEDPNAYRQWGTPPEGRSFDARKSSRRRRPGRLGRALARTFVWLGALAFFLAIVGAAGLLLQFRGLPWMPAQVLARIPPWLSALFRR